MVTQQVFRFLDLPVELRLRIYGFVFPCHRGFVRFFHKTAPNEGMIRPANVKTNLLLACRKIHDEALSTLYRVNTFCILPVMNPKNDKGKEIIASTVNDKWISSMPLQGRNNITNIEMRLPVVNEIETNPYGDMSSLFPSLRIVTYFFDDLTHDGAGRYGFGEALTREDHVIFFTTLKQLMPQPAKVELDSFGLDEYPRYADLISAASEVFGFDNSQKSASSKFIEQENRWAQEFHDRDNAVMKFLEETGPDEAGGMQFELGYWDLRHEGGFGGDVDDDSEEEEHILPSNWNVRKGAQDRIEMFNFDF